MACLAIQLRHSRIVSPEIGSTPVPAMLPALRKRYDNRLERRWLDMVESPAQRPANGYSGKQDCCIVNIVVLVNENR